MSKDADRPNKKGCALIFACSGIKDIRKPDKFRSSESTIELQGECY